MALLVPLGVVTRTLAVPALPAGVLAVMVVAFTTVTPVAAAPPIVTDDAPVKFVPVIVTDCPPAGGPVDGLMPVTVGAAMYVYKPSAVTAPLRVVTCTFAAPAVRAGVVALIVVAFTTDQNGTPTPPIVNAVNPVKSVPVIVTD